MQIKTFRAKSIQEALQLVREKLGPDACVLDTREVRGGLIRRPMIEVDASSHREPKNRIAATLEVTQQSSTASRVSIDEEFDQPSLATQLLENELKSSGAVVKNAVQTQNPMSGQERVENLASLHSRLLPGNTIQEIQSNASQIVDPSFSDTQSGTSRSSSPAAREVLGELMAQGIEGELAAEIVSRAAARCAPDFRNDAWLIRGQVSQILVERLKVATADAEMPYDQKMIAVVGPSGVGKTTFLSKLAHRAHHEWNQQIGIVAMDTWRHGAVEQYLELAETLNVEVEVVGGMEQLAPALQRLREFDLVLIDTAGRSPQDLPQIEFLKEMLQIAQPTETQLVMSASASQSHIKHTIQRFASVGLTHVCLTKLDEGNSLGHWLSLLLDSGLLLQYLSHGPSVEKDLMNPNKRHLASLFLGQTQLHAIRESVS